MFMSRFQCEERDEKLKMKKIQFGIPLSKIMKRQCNIAFFSNKPS